ncbi:Transcriptional regulator of nonfermentable carbon utilization [Ascosphaera aggregata]|nr:Transcriptional regulator of nonfermentable carbon utilization [Ascosphaera aggregata]
MVVPSSYDNGANNLNTRASVSPTFTLPSSASGTTATESTSTAATLSGLGDPGFNPAFFDPSHPALFNFDLASMNFDNHYGAMEFGILAHMTGTGNGSVNDGNVMSANDSVSTPRPHSTSTTVTTNATRLADPNHETSGSTCTVPSLDSPNDSGNMPYGAMFDGTSSLSTAGNWPAANGAASGLALGDLSDYKYAQPSETTTNAFVIGSTRTPSLTSDSPESDADTFIADHGEEVGSLPGCGGRDTERDTKEVRKPWTKPLRKRSSQGGVQNQSTNPRKRRRSPGQLYKSVKKPYSYTNGFHTLTAYIHKRFSPSKTLQIAKALASIRPSLIATNKTLDAADLVFMEKCFQRTLWEYEDFINVVGTPTIICRRTGEVAAVGEEFCMLTGWKKEILLGQDHNENVNMGGGSGNGRKSIRNNWPFRENNNNSNNNTAAAQLSADENQPRPVLLAELLDDESVIEFYDDFAKLAFGDSRGSIMATCKLLKYQTKNDIEAEKRQGSVNGEQWSDVQPRWAKKGIAGQQGLSRLGASDGKVECSYCWTVKRDVFDIPMLIVMNVSVDGIRYIQEYDGLTGLN